METALATANEITQAVFDEMRQRFTEEYYLALKEKAGGRDMLLALTSGKPRGQVEFVVDSFSLEGETSAKILNTACRFLLDTEALYDGLEALPWGDDG